MRHSKKTSGVKILSNRTEMDFPSVFAIAIIASFFVSLIVNFFTHGAVFSGYYFSELDVGMDFFNSMIYVNGGKPYLTYGTLYPPLANLLYYFLQLSVPYDQVANWPDITWETGDQHIYNHRGQEMDLRVHSSSMMLFLLFMVFVVLGIFFLSYKIVQKSTKYPGLVAFSALLTSGMLFSIDRGNIILLSVVCSLFFVCYWNDERFWISELALIALAISAGLKLYPALLGVLLIQQKQWKRAIRTVFYGIACFFLPFFAFHGVESIEKFFSALFRFNQYDPTVSPNGLSFLQISNSLMALCSIKERGGGFEFAKMSATIVLVVAVVLCCFWRNHWKSVALLSLLTIAVPGQSMNYSILNLIVPLMLMLATPKEKVGRWKNLYICLFFFSFAILPWQIIVLPYRMYTLTTVNFVLQIVVLLFIVILLFDGLLEQISQIRKKGLK